MNHWIFQANPDKFDVDTYIERQGEILWSVRQTHFRGEMNPGDRVHIWRAQGKRFRNKNYGVIVEGTISGTPEFLPDDASDLWRVADTVEEPTALRVPVSIIRKSVGNRQVIQGKSLAADPITSQMNILKIRNLTNYLITKEESERISHLISNTGVNWTGNAVLKRKAVKRGQGCDTSSSKSIESGIWSSDGRKLDSKFTLEVTNGNFNLILHARGGSLNSEYLPALELLLLRLSEVGALIAEITLQRTNETRPLSERRLLREYPRPVRLAKFEIPSLRRQITREASRIRDDATSQRSGGNPTKRLLISLKDAAGYDFEGLLQLLSGNVSIQAQAPSKPQKTVLGTNANKEDELDDSEGEDRSFESNPFLRVRGTNAHRRISNLLIDHVHGIGHSPPKPVSEPFYDMAWSDESNIWLAEIKSLTDENETHQMRLGLAQLLEYKHKLTLLHKKQVSPWLVVEYEPKNPMWLGLLGSLQVKLTWPGEWETQSV